MKREMTKKLLLLLLALAVLAIPVFAACWETPKCPIHDVGTVRFANQQKVIEGHTYFLYHCSAGPDGGHDFWVRCDY